MSKKFILKICFFLLSRNFVPSKKNLPAATQQSQANNPLPSPANNANLASPVQQQQQTVQNVQGTYKFLSMALPVHLIWFIIFSCAKTVLSAPAAEPLFVTVPPRPQRVLHSEAYLKYIESLQSDTRFVTPWEKTLRATKDTTPAVDPTKLPMHWLGPKSPEKSSDALDELWKLRNYMMKDIVTIIHPSNY